jgi:hypothetical protein
MGECYDFVTITIPDFSVHVSGRLLRRVPFLESTASSRPRRRAYTVKWGTLSACIRADLAVIRVL